MLSYLHRVRNESVAKRNIQIAWLSAQNNGNEIFMKGKAHPRGARMYR